MTSRRVLLAAFAFVATASIGVSASSFGGPAQCVAACADTYGAAARDCTPKCGTDAPCLTTCFAVAQAYYQQCTEGCRGSTSASSVGESWCEQQCNNAPNAAQCMARCRRVAVGISSESAVQDSNCEQTCESADQYCISTGALPATCGRLENLCLAACRASPPSAPVSVTAQDSNCEQTCVGANQDCLNTGALPATCGRLENLCLAACRASPPSAPMVTGVRECVKECTQKGKDASNACKHEKFAKRAQCYAQVPNTVKACEAGCNRKPHLAAPVRTLTLVIYPADDVSCKTAGKKIAFGGGVCAKLNISYFGAAMIELGTYPEYNLDFYQVNCDEKLGPMATVPGRYNECQQMDDFNFAILSTEA